MFACIREFEKCLYWIRLIVFQDKCLSIFEKVGLYFRKVNSLKAVIKKLASIPQKADMI